MSTTIALREDLDTTLASLRADLTGGSDSSVQTNSINLDHVRIDASADSPAIDLGSAQVPVTKTGLGVLADTLKIPTPFFERLGNLGGVEEQAQLIAMLLNHTSETGMTATYNDAGLLDLSPPNAMRIDPVQSVDILARVLGSTESPIQRVINTPAEFAIDVHVPMDSQRGIGGDSGGEAIPESLRGYSWATNSTITDLSRVGDVTAAGVRLRIDRKNNRTPSVSGWMMRLACTNGMETPSELTKIDARGMTVDEVLLDLEHKARLAFEQVEGQIEHFYAMRDVRVDNPERRLRAIARERGIPDRSLMRMLDVAPEALGSTTTEFDVACLVSNFGNHPSIRNDGGRLLLEGAAGRSVIDHAVRCNSCNHVLLD